MLKDLKNFSKYQEFINFINFPLQILLYLIPHMDLTGNFKYLPIIFWNILFISANHKEILTTVKKNGLVFAFIGAVVLSSLVTKIPSEIIKASLLFFNAFLLLNTKIYSEKHIKIILGFIFLTCLIPRFNQPGFFTSIYNHHNTFAVSLTFGLHLVSILKLKTWSKLASWSLLLIALYFTKSRGAMVFVLIYFSFQLFFKANIKFLVKKYALLTLTLTIIFSYFSILHFGQNLNQYLEASPKIHQGKKLLSLSRRDELYNKAVDIISNNPFGIGSLRSKELFKESFGINTPHNLFLKIAVDYGCLSLLLYVVLFLSVFYRSNNPYFLSFFLAYHVKLMADAALPFGFSLASVLIIYPPLFLLTPKGVNSKS